MTEWDAKEYSRQSSLQQAMAGEVLALLDLKGAERVLDVGCGDGKITAEVAARLPRGSVLGVDPSRDMIAFASSHFGLAFRPNLRFAEADVRRLPFRHEFDLVVSFNALHWVPEQDSALRSIRSALRPDGRSVLRLVPAGERKSLEDVIEDVRQSPRWSDHFQGFRKPYVHLTPGQYAALAEHNGFRVLRLHTQEKAWDFKTREAFLAFCQVTLVEWARLLPEADRPAFILDVLGRYRSVAADRPGEENTFKFYQMDVLLAPRPREGRPEAGKQQAGSLPLGPDQKLFNDLWEEHIRDEFVRRDTDATLDTMVPDAYVNHVPVMTGGVGREQLREFYGRRFIPKMPPDTDIVPVSRTIGADRLVDEMIFRFTHTLEMDWMLPGLAPTGRRVEVPLVVIVHFREGKLAHEHIYWDQASVLVQLGLLDPAGLPVAGGETARKVLDPDLPSNELIRQADARRGQSSVDPSARPAEPPSGS
jgi:trans-aconitate methyltransferase